MIRVGEVLQLVSRIGKICTLHLPALLEASTQRRVIPPTVQIQTTTSPQQNSAVKSSDGCNGGGPGHPQTFTSLIYYCPFCKHNSCKFLTCLLSMQQIMFSPTQMFLKCIQTLFQCCFLKVKPNDILCQ